MAEVISITQENFESEVTQSDVPVLDELASEKGDSCKIAKVNIDDCRDLAVTYNVKSIPMLLFFKDGEVRDEVVGLINKEAISSKLDAIA